MDDKTAQYFGLIYDLEIALGAALGTNYPMLMHVKRLMAAFREIPKNTANLEDGAAFAIVSAFGWDQYRKAAEISRYTTTLAQLWADEDLRYARVAELLDCAPIDVPAWAYIRREASKAAS
jgi:hypothetical protein